MPFTIPNKPSAFGNQARFDSGVLAILAQAFNHQHVVTGCAVTSLGTMQLAVAAGTGRFGANIVTVPAGNVTVTANATGSSRIDLVVFDSSGTKSVLAGTAAGTPLWPAHTIGEGAAADYVVLSRVEVPTGLSSVPSNYLTDMRVIRSSEQPGPAELLYLAANFI